LIEFPREFVIFQETHEPNPDLQKKFQFIFDLDREMRKGFKTEDFE
jgi:hypothetical protein